MAAMVSPWGKAGAWALDSEEHEAQLLKEEEQQKQAELGLDFPSLNDALATKQKKKGKTISLGEFNASGGTRSSAHASVQQGLTHEDLMTLPTGPRQRTAEELDRNKLGGGFRNYGSYDRNSRYSNGDDSSDSKWGSARVSDDNRRNNGGSRGDGGKEFAPSRADEVDNWATTKKPMSGNGFERRDRGGFSDSLSSKADEVVNWATTKKPMSGNGFERRDRGGFSDSLSSKADESESWVSSKSNLPSDGRRSGGNGGFDREWRGGGFTTSGGGADSEIWGRKKEEGNGGGSVSGRPKLNLQPRTLPVSNVKSETQTPGTVARSKSSNPFGAARPREEVLAEKGHDWKKLDEQLESKMKEETAEKTEIPNGPSLGKKSLSNGTGRAAEDRTEKSWRKPESPESHPGSLEENENGDCEVEVEGSEN